MEKCVLAIDPGSSKCGIALVNRTKDDKLELLWRGVFPEGELEERAKEAMTIRPYSLVIIGSGTKSKKFVHRLREAMPSMGVLVVDEVNTSHEARARYWEHNPRKGLRRLLPSTLQVPPEPVDDFVALILAERVLLD